MKWDSTVVSTSHKGPQHPPSSFFTSLMEQSFELECRALADKGSQTDAFYVMFTDWWFYLNSTNLLQKWPAELISSQQPLLLFTNLRQRIRVRTTQEEAAYSISLYKMRCVIPRWPCGLLPVGKAWNTSKARYPEDTLIGCTNHLGGPTIWSQLILDLTPLVTALESIMLRATLELLPKLCTCLPSDHFHWHFALKILG